LAVNQPATGRESVHQVARGRRAQA
jgi:hypothetical protein